MLRTDPGPDRFAQETEDGTGPALDPQERQQFQPPFFLNRFYGYLRLLLHARFGAHDGNHRYGRVANTLAIFWAAVFPILG
jgi:hypothetical protein